MSNTTERTFDRVPGLDPENRNYPIRTLLRTAAVRRSMMWRPGPILDQGREGACVGYAWAAEALGAPIAVVLSEMRVKMGSTPNEFARNLYLSAQKLDSWPGEAYEGTSVGAGAKAMRAAGLLREYRWAFGIEDVIETVLSYGPVVCGVPWKSDMYTAPNGKLSATGTVVGGHAIKVVGYKKNTLPSEDGLYLQNSWGDDWGNLGIAEIKISDFAALLKDQGDACVPVSRSYGR